MSDTNLLELGEEQKIRTFDPNNSESQMRKHASPKRSNKETSSELIVLKQEILKLQNMITPLTALINLGNKTDSSSSKSGQTTPVKS